jgi:uncharacterized protein YodC (DUF2158 family)
METQFKPGDVVCLRTNSPRMTVEVVGDTTVQTVWFEGSILRFGTFSKASVMVRGEKREAPEPLNEAIDYTLGESKVGPVIATVSVPKSVKVRWSLPGDRPITGELPPDGSEKCDACGQTAFRQSNGSLACYNYNCVDYFWKPTGESNTDELVKKARAVFTPIKAKLEALAKETEFEFGGEKIPATNWNASDYEVQTALDARFRLYNKALKLLLDRTQAIWDRSTEKQ